jgi:hypothetical protein
VPENVSFTEERVKKLVMTTDEMGLAGLAGDRLRDVDDITHYVDLVVLFYAEFRLLGINGVIKVRIEERLRKDGFTFGMKEYDPDVMEARRRISLTRPRVR